MKHLSFLFCLWCFSCGKTDSTPPFKPLGNSIAYIVNGGDNSLTIVDLNNFEKKQTLFLKNSPALFPHHIYISPLSNTLSIATSDYDFSLGHAGIHNYAGKGYVLLLNSETGELKRNIELPAPGHNAVPSADGKEVWVALSMHAGKVMIFDTETGELKG
jgi:DNA-binding beta-propeller fold protein YncE